MRVVACLRSGYGRERGGFRVAVQLEMIDRTVEAVVFDWDGTAVSDRRASATPVRRRVVDLSAAGVDIAVVTGTHVDNIDRQLRARPPGPGRLWLCVNRGSELFEVTAGGPVLAARRVASPAEETALDEAAKVTVDLLTQRGMPTRLVSSRLNRRKIDLLAEPEWADPPKARIAELLAATSDRLRRHGIADLCEVVQLATESAWSAGLRDPRITSDVKHVEIGLSDKSDSMRELLTLLEGRGVGPGLVLIVGDEFGPLGGVPGSDSLLLVPEAQRAIAASVGVEPGGVPAGVIPLGSGPAGLLALLDEQLQRRRARRVPSIDEDPAWTISADLGDPMRRRVTETIFTLGAAGFATRGSAEEPDPASTPLVLADGIYRGHGPDEQLLPGPEWTSLLVNAPPADDSRVLDLRTGVLIRRELVDGAPALRTFRFASVALRGVVGLRAEAAVGRLRPGDPFRRPAGMPGPSGGLGKRHWARTGPAGGGGIGVVGVQHVGRSGSIRTVERIAAYVAARRRPPGLRRATVVVDAAVELGFDQLLADHRAAWAARWADVDVRIPDDEETQLAVRFALFQLSCNVNRHGESAVGARGLSGRGYAGHVFWDADVFVLPAMVSIDPLAARAMIRYRLRRLAAARAYAAAGGYDGARFPWESAATGDDVTPVTGSLGGNVVPIRTGQQEEHITADVAWAAAHCAAWTRWGAAERGPELPLLLDTARYWASRCRRDIDGSVHIDNVIGPDEYHESVNDDCYTNVMARWNLRAAADAADRAGIGGDEPARWRAIAERLVDGYDSATGRYEQFAGFFALEPLLIADVAEPPVAADLLLGRERVAASQLIKQPDVLMLHHLVPSETHRGSLEPNLDFYGPRTAHGSSLSPSVSSALLARAGRPDAALAMLGHALALDVGDRTGMTAAGLHMANLGGIWQAVLHGFAGVTLQAGMLTIDPCLPSGWGSLEVRFRCRARRARLTITRDGISIRTDGPLLVCLAGGEPRLVSGTARLGTLADCESGERRGP